MIIKKAGLSDKPQRIVAYLDGLQAKVNALPALCSSGRLQSPTLRYGDGSQSASGEDAVHGEE